MPNYNYVIDSSFRPFSMEEVLTPLTLYKGAYDEAEAGYQGLSEQADKFKYLSETLPEESKARQIYEGYANNLAAQASDLAKHGLNINNRRALTELKRRYQGEIGRLQSADEAFQEEKKLRKGLEAKDPTMLYANDNITIDDFLDGNTPNTYSVSGQDLYNRGAQAGQSASSRIYQSTRVANLTNHFKELTQTVGYDPALIEAFKKNLAAIPELQQAVDDILEEKGVTTNLEGANYNRARQSVINGIVDGAVYKETRSQKENPEVMSAAEQNAADLKAAAAGLVRNEDGRGYHYEITADPEMSGKLWMYKIENGQIVGFSDEFMKKYEAGEVNKQGDPITKKEKEEVTALDPIQTKDAWVYVMDKSGTQEGPMGSSKDWTAPAITYKELLAKYPQLGATIAAKYGNDASFYLFYEDTTEDGKTRIRVVPDKAKIANENVLRKQGKTSVPEPGTPGQEGTGSGHDDV